MNGLHSMILCMHLEIIIGSWYDSVQFLSILTFFKRYINLTSHARAWMQEKMYPELASASAAGREPVLESMCGNTMTSDDDRLSFFSSFFPTPALDISSQKLAPFAFVKKTSLLLALACVAQLWHNGARSILTEPVYVFMLIRFHEIIKVLRG